MRTQFGFGEALFAEREQVEFPCAVEEGLGGTESGVADGVVTELAGVGFGAESEDVLFDGSDALETPVFVFDLADDVEIVESDAGFGLGELGPVEFRALARLAANWASDMGAVADVKYRLPESEIAGGRAD